MEQPIARVRVTGAIRVWCTADVTPITAQLDKVGFTPILGPPEEDATPISLNVHQVDAELLRDALVDLLVLLPDEDETEFSGRLTVPAADAADTEQALILGAQHGFEGRRLPRERDSWPATALDVSGARLLDLMPLLNRLLLSG